MVFVGFLLVVLLGSYVQSVAGFAMAMIIVAVVGGLRMMDVPTLAAVVSLLTMLNVALALRGALQHVERRVFVWLACGQVPAIFAGVQLLQWLDSHTRTALEICLGLFITVGGLSMLLRPHAWRRVSGPAACISTGVAGGLMGGLFSASGPVLGWFGYSQPLPLAAIRATLLASFALTTTTRTIIVGVDGALTQQVLLYAAAGLPVVALGTWLGRQFAPPVSEDAIKHMAYTLLLVMGAWILLRAGLCATQPSC